MKKLKCPICGSEEKFLIEADMPVNAIVDNKQDLIESDYSGDSMIYWGETNTCTCMICIYSEILKEFENEN